MKNRIDATFTKLQQRKQAAFMPFLTCGDPGKHDTVEFLTVMADAGADLIELGFPFSDPVADGPTIQASYTRAIAAGFQVEDALQAVKRFRKRHDTPVIAMVSESIVYRKGASAMLDNLARAGFDGVIIPDLPVEEAADVAGTCRRNMMHPIFLMAPSTTGHRQTLITRHGSGFLYYVSVMGTTGVRKTLATGLQRRIVRLRNRTPLPIAVGFGVSTARQAKTVASFADGVIVGSALVDLLNPRHTPRRHAVRRVGQFVAELAGAVHAARKA